MKSATIYNYKDVLLFVTNNRFKDGIVRKTLQIKTLNKNESSEILTNALKKCFEDFKNNVGLNSEVDKKFRATITHAVDLKKYKDFLIGSSMIELVEVSEEVKMQPLISSTKFNGYVSFKGVIESYSKEDLENHKVIQAALRLFEQMGGGGISTA